MGAKSQYYDNLSHCKDWLIWTDPFTYRLIRLMGGEMPCGMQTSSGGRTYIFNGDHSFTMTNSRYGMYNCSKFYSEEKLYKMLTSWCQKQWGRDDSVDTVIKYYLQAPNDLYDKLIALPRDYSQNELRTLCLSNDRHHEVEVAKIWGADLQPLSINGKVMFLRLEGYKNNTAFSARNKVYCSESGSSQIDAFKYLEVTRL